MQSTLQTKDNFHVGIIMDGNGRWATRRGLTRTAGHRAGAEAVRRVAEAAPALGIDVLTLFAFSADNWRRPSAEVTTLMALLAEFLRKVTARLIESGMRLTVIGRRDRLPEGLADRIAETETATAAGTRLHLRIAVDYSARDAILRAAQRLAANPAQATRFAEWLCGPGPESVDLVIRSGGEQRLSDFMLWESAYAELWFTEVLWPDFGAEDLQSAIAAFQRRERRFGGLSGAASVPQLGAVAP